MEFLSKLKDEFSADKELLTDAAGKPIEGGIASLAGTTVALYFSSHWCPPCKEFTPILKDFFETVNEKKTRLTIVFISSDNIKRDGSVVEEGGVSVLRDYMAGKHGDWCAIESLEVRSALKQRFQVCAGKEQADLGIVERKDGIPTLAVLNPDGTCVTMDGVNQVMKLGLQAMKRWESNIAANEQALSEQVPSSGIVYPADNIFAKIIGGSIPSYKVFETEHALAFLDAFPVVPGHSLLIPKKLGYATIMDMPANEASAFLAELPRLARAVQNATGAEGINIYQNNGKVAGQEVFHVHFHVVPRFENDKDNNGNSLKDTLKPPPSAKSMIASEDALAMLAKIQEHTK